MHDGAFSHFRGIEGTTDSAAATVTGLGAESVKFHTISTDSKWSKWRSQKSGVTLRSLAGRLSRATEPISHHRPPFADLAFVSIQPDTHSVTQLKIACPLDHF